MRLSGDRLVWVDVLTPKQALLFSKLISFLSKRNYKAIVTTRSYDYTVDILKTYKISHVSIGKYGGGSLSGKLKASISRQLKMIDFLLSLPSLPDISISFSSPDSTRVAFGLGIPVITLTDSPHSKFVNKITLPLSSAVVAPECVGDGLRRYLVSDTLLYTFDGVFEAAWIRGFKPNPQRLIAFGLEPFRYTIIRLEEKKAAYYPLRVCEHTRLTPIIKGMLEYSKVVLYPRYTDQREFITRRFQSFIANSRLVVPSRGVEVQSLEYYARLVITGGSSMAHESALLGTPSISTFPEKLAVTEYIRSKGFPIYHVPDVERALDRAVEIYDNHEKYRLRNFYYKVNKLEDPLLKIHTAMTEMLGRGQKKI